MVRGRARILTVHQGDITIVTVKKPSIVLLLAIACIAASAQVSELGVAVLLCPVALTGAKAEVQLELYREGATAPIVATADDHEGVVFALLVPGKYYVSRVAASWTAGNSTLTTTSSLGKALDIPGPGVYRTGKVQVRISDKLFQGASMDDGLELQKGVDPATYVKSYAKKNKGLASKPSLFGPPQKAGNSAELPGPLRIEGAELLQGVVPSLVSRAQRAAKVFTCSFKSEESLAVEASCAGKSAETPSISASLPMTTENLFMVLRRSEANEYSLTVYFPAPGEYELYVSFKSDTAGVKREAVFDYRIAVDSAYASAADVFVARLDADSGRDEPKRRSDLFGLLGKAIEASKDGRAPLYFAVLRQDRPAVSWLLGVLPTKDNPLFAWDETRDEKGAVTSRSRLDPEDRVLLNNVDPQGRSALMLAAGEDDAATIKLLLDSGAYPFLTDSAGKTASDYAAENGNAAAAALLPPEKNDSAAVEGDWRGTLLCPETFTDRGYDLRLSIRREGDRLLGESLMTAGVLAKEYPLVQAGKSADIVGHDKAVLKGRYDVYVYGGRLYAFSRGLEVVRKGVFDPLPYGFSGRLSGSSRILGLDSVPEGMAPVVLERVGLATPIKPLSIKRGEVVKLECADAPRFHYYCYLPKSYDPKRPAPLLVFDGAGGNAKPLSTSTAEELGWISVGLVESSNDIEEDSGVYACEVCMAAALSDIRQRFAVDPDRLYLGGSSGGAQRSLRRARVYRCAGVIEIIGGFCDPIYDGVPVFCIEGEKDNLGSRLIARYPELKADYGDLLELKSHPGGHDWWQPKLHAEAMRWIDARFKSGK